MIAFSCKFVFLTTLLKMGIHNYKKKFNPYSYPIPNPILNRIETMQKSTLAYSSFFLKHSSSIQVRGRIYRLFYLSTVSQSYNSTSKHNPPECRAEFVARLLTVWLHPDWSVLSWGSVCYLGIGTLVPRLHPY